MTMEGVAGNPWAVLGVPFGSSREVSRAAYRRLAMDLHPDRNPGAEKSAAARLVVLNEAWAEISSAPKPVRPTSPFAAAFEDLVRESEDFEAALRPGTPERGSDAEAVVHLGFAESLSDRQHTITARTSDGRVRTTTVVIPGGVADGEVVVFRGLGEPGKAGGRRGDLQLKVAVEPGTGFEIRGLDVHREIKLPVWDAALGCEIPVPLPRGGTRHLRLPAGSAATVECRLAGEGVSTGAARGDYVVLVSVQVPDAVADPKLSKLFAAMRPGRLVAA